jgi:hypothetical protein
MFIIILYYYRTVAKFPLPGETRVTLLLGLLHYFNDKSTDCHYISVHIKEHIHGTVMGSYKKLNTGVIFQNLHTNIKQQQLGQNRPFPEIYMSLKRILQQKQTHYL